MKKYFLSISLFLSLCIYAQKENDNWYFGFDAGMNFSNPTNPVALTDNASHWSNSSVSDANGNLLFYTDGKNIWNREHQIMQNGSINSILTNAISYLHDDAIAQDPFNSNRYYIFSTITFYSNNSSNTTLTGGVCTYSIIDMSLGSSGANGMPLGDVVSGGNSLPLLDTNGNTFFSNQVNIVKHGDGSSIWALIPNKNQMYSYKINHQGVVNSPVVSDLPNFNFSTNDFSQYALNTSPVISGTNNFSNFIYLSLLATNNPSSAKVISFNNDTGKITNDFLLDITNDLGVSYANEFSQDASVLYVPGMNSLYGINLFNIGTNVNYYSVPINYPVNNLIYGPMAMRRIKNGDIYFTSLSTQYYVGRITNANVFNGASSVYDYIYSQGKSVNTHTPLPKIVFPYSNNCNQNYNLVSQEVNVSYAYHASNTITTNTNYVINTSQDIKMKAGSSILLEPNTTINGKFSAEIENCTVGSPVTRFSDKQIRFSKPIKQSLDLRRKNITESKGIKIFPNPTSDILNIKTDSKINSVSVFDISGKKVNVKLDGDKVDVRSLPAGTYLINVETKDGISTEKFIKK